MQRKNAISISAATFLALCLSSVAKAEPVPPAIQATYAKMIKAWDGRDFKTYATFFAPNFVIAHPESKPVSGAKYLGEVKAQLKTAKSASLKVTFKNATVRKGIVDVEFETTRIIVTPEMQAKMDAQPKDGPQLSHIPVFHEVGVDSWKKVGKNWVKVKTFIKSMSAVM